MEVAKPKMCCCECYHMGISFPLGNACFNVWEHNCSYMKTPFPLMETHVPLFKNIGCSCM